MPNWKHANLSAWDVAYAASLTVASYVSYCSSTYLVSLFAERDSIFLSGMWSVIATVFVFRETRESSLSAGVSRLIATCVSFVLCLIYLLLFPFTPEGLALLLGGGAIMAMLIGRRGDMVTIGITTTVVMVVAGMSPKNAWQQPLLRFLDTIVGIVVGVAFKSLGSLVYRTSRGNRPVLG